MKDLCKNHIVNAIQKCALSDIDLKKWMLEKHNLKAVNLQGEKSLQPI